MGVNKATNGLGNRVVRTMKHHERELIALKKRQLLGADNVIKIYTEILSATLSLSAGQGVNLQITVTPQVAQIMQLEPEWALFLTNGVDGNYLWPAGASLTSDQKYKVRAYMHRNMYHSDMNTGAAGYFLTIVNDTAGSLNCHVKFCFVTDKLRTA